MSRVRRHFFGKPIPEKMGPLKIWEWPEANKKYVVGIDVAEGKVRDIGSVSQRARLMAQRSDRPDYSCAVVIEQETAKHVATWNGWISPNDFGETCLAIGYFYNAALLAPERNTYGLSVLEVLLDQHYPHVYRKHVSVGVISDDAFMPEFGWTTSVTTKPVLIGRLHEILKENPEFTRDAELVAELRTMEIEPGRGEARATGRNKDDRVMALAIALQARREYLSGNQDPSDDPYEGLSREDRRAWKALDRRNTNAGMDPSRGRLGFGPRDRDFRAQCTKGSGLRYRGRG